MRNSLLVLEVRVATNYRWNIVRQDVFTNKRGE